jgi:ABC-2 type transport system permease protein
MIKTILWLKYKSIKAQLQYPFNFITALIGICTIGVMDILLLLIPVNAFKSIGGWNFWELGFLFSLLKISHGLHQAIFIPFWGHDEIVRKGNYDLYLVRPIHPIFQILVSDFSVAALGEWIPSITLLVITAHHVKVEWDLFNILFFLIIVISGAIIEWSVVLFISGFSFWFVRTQGIKFVADMFMFGASIYPVHIFGRTIQFILTFIFPYAFMAYYPTHYFFNMKVEIFYNIFPYITPSIIFNILQISHSIIRFHIV